MQRVIENFLPEVVTPYLRRSVAKDLGIRPCEVWRTNEGTKAFSRRLRRCLFVGLSDGSRIDALRRANADRLSQEQVVPMMHVDDDKWRGLSKDLRGEEEGMAATFSDVLLIDDFTASGTTSIRFRLRAGLLDLTLEQRRTAAARCRLAAAIARNDRRPWVVKRRERTRQLIELDGLVA